MADHSSAEPVVARRGWRSESASILAGVALALVMGLVVFGLSQALVGSGTQGHVAGVFDVLPGVRTAPTPQSPGNLPPVYTPPVVPEVVGPTPEELARLEAIRQEHLTPEWLEVQAVLRGRSPTKAALALAQYREEHPKSVLLAEVDNLLDQQMDRIWWNRISQLMTRRDALKQQQGSLASQLRREYSPAARQPIMDQQAIVETELARINRELYDMHYSLPIAPNLADVAVMRELRRARDKDIYSIWKQRLLPRLIQSNGDFPIGWELTPSNPAPMPTTTPESSPASSPAN